jgi:two-component sensor histidine kinase
MGRRLIIVILLATGLSNLFLLLGLLYNWHRTKQRHNKQLETKQQEINEKNILLERLIIDKDNLMADKNDLLKEKEWLINEIHHRVKNNLQLVISLLSAQSEFLNNPSALNAIRESQERMQAIALIHQKLYQADNTTRVNMRSYISELVESIRNRFSEFEKISFHLNADDISLDISQSMPLGLILNEAITNAIKYAYPKNEKGDIRISLQYSDSDKLQLKIADNGKGLPADFNTERSNSLGLQLIKLFSEQLDGDLHFINNNGLEIILNFKPQVMMMQLN